MNKVLYSNHLEKYTKRRNLYSRFSRTQTQIPYSCPTSIDHTQLPGTISRHPKTLLRRVNDVLKAHWQTFSHSTCTRYSIKVHLSISLFNYPRGEYPDYAFIFEVDPVAETLAIRDCTAKVRTTYKYGGQGWQEGWEKMIGILDAWEAKQGRRFKSWRCLIDIAASLWE